jgi:hypothetical protein
MRRMVDLTVFSLLSFLPLERVYHSPHENNYTVSPLIAYGTFFYCVSNDTKEQFLY